MVGLDYALILVDVSDRGADFCAAVYGGDAQKAMGGKRASGLSPDFSGVRPD